MIISLLLSMLASSPAVPLPERWDPSNDYPTEARRDGAEGTAKFEVLIGIDGKARNCRIIESAGHPALDEATCRVVVRRGRWKPARDDDDKAVESNFSSSFTWIIPQ